MPQLHIMSHEIISHFPHPCCHCQCLDGKYGRTLIPCRQFLSLAGAVKKWADLQPLFTMLAVSQYTIQSIYNQFSYLEADRRAKLSSHLPSPTVTNDCVAVLLIKHSWWITQKIRSSTSCMRRGADLLAQKKFWANLPPLFWLRLCSFTTNTDSYWIFLLCYCPLTSLSAFSLCQEPHCLLLQSRNPKKIL